MAMGLFLVLWDGSNLYPMYLKYSTEIISKGTPIKPNSKNENPVNPFSTKALLTIMLGGVPVNVSNPPVLEPNATGINSLEGKVPAFQAADTLTGSNAATVPVLLTKPDNKLEPRVTITSKREMFRLAHFTKNCPAMAVQPVLDSPSPIIKRAAIIITVGLLNPVNVSPRSKIPVR
jgi:hypothetical protein